MATNSFGPADRSSKRTLLEESKISPLSYTALIKDFNRFRAIARSESDMYDMPGQVFFRVLFHFDNGADIQETAPGTESRSSTTTSDNAWTGLIAPSWLEFGNDFNNQAEDMSVIEKLWASSTAFNYFVLNGDTKRAELTKHFVELLSSISANSPWYFQNIKGLDAAIERAITVPGADFAFKDERDKITIECLDDSYDQRIGTLLDLYRAIVWSWETKRQMLPVNLRKFDMTIIAFQMPLRGKHITRNNLDMGKIAGDLTSDDATGESISKIIDKDGITNIYTTDPGTPVASFKAWEFHGCEIDYNSSKSGWGELDNAAGSVPKYNIDIYFDDVFETRFNEFIGTTITDVIGDNSAYMFDNNLEVAQLESISTDDKTSKEYSEPGKWPNIQGPQHVGSNMFGAKPRGVSGILDQLVGTGEEWVNSKLRKIYLGNMNGLSISKLNRQIDQALDGDLWGTVHNVANYVRGNYKGGGNMELGANIFPKTESRSDRIIELGNIFRANTTLNT